MKMFFIKKKKFQLKLKKYRLIYSKQHKIKLLYFYTNLEKH